VLVLRISEGAEDDALLGRHDPPNLTPRVDARNHGLPLVSLSGPDVHRSQDMGLDGCVVGPQTRALDFGCEGAALALGHRSDGLGF
jgi:hypothetical protein